MKPDSTSSYQNLMTEYGWGPELVSIENKDQWIVREDLEYAIALLLAGDIIGSNNTADLMQEMVDILYPH